MKNNKIKTQSRHHNRKITSHYAWELHTCSEDATPWWNRSNLVGKEEKTRIPTAGLRYDYICQLLVEFTKN